MIQQNLDKAQALHLDGDHAAALTAYKAALSAGENASRCHLGIGLIELAQDHLEAAIASLKSAAAADPINPDILTALGAAFIRAEQPAKATTVLAETIKRAPNSIEPRLQLARAFTSLTRYDDALRILSETVQSFPEDAEAWHLKGNIERQANKSDDAHLSLQKTIELSPQNEHAFNDLGVICRALGRYEDAERHYRTALLHAPDLAIAHANLGNTLERQNRLEDAEDSLRTAYTLNPKAKDAAYNLAVVLTKLERPAEAIPLFQQVVSEDPSRWDGWTNLGVAKLDTGDLEGAEAALRRSLERKPTNPEAHYNLAWLLLLSDRHAEGWSELEWRWQLPEFSSGAQPQRKPNWSGDALDGQTLLVHAEQGFGDAIQFARFIADIPRKESRIVLQCHAPLVRLLAPLDGVDEVLALDAPPPRHDIQVPLLSLPKTLLYDGQRTHHSAGYISPPDSTPDTLKIPDSGKKRIGLVWAGAAENKINQRRTIEIDAFLPLFDSTTADFISLQVGPQSDQSDHFPSDRMAYSCDGKVADFQDTAAVISQLDLVIGVDTAVIHLAGALGIPTWVLLPFMPDYRWGLGRPNTPWYDSLRLFRQPEHGNWPAVMDDICAALRSW